MNITQSDIARTGFVTRGAVSLLLTFRVKSVGIDMCRAISAAMGIPLITVFRKAGLLPDVPAEQVQIEDWEYILSQLPAGEREELRQIAQMKIDRNRQAEATARTANYKPGKEKG